MCMTDDLDYIHDWFYLSAAPLMALKWSPLLWPKQVSNDKAPFCLIKFKRKARGVSNPVPGVLPCWKTPQHMLVRYVFKHGSWFKLVLSWLLSGVEGMDEAKTQSLEENRLLLTKTNKQTNENHPVGEKLNWLVSRQGRARQGRAGQGRTRLDRTQTTSNIGTNPHGTANTRRF